MLNLFQHPETLKRVQGDALRHFHQSLPRTCFGGDTHDFRQGRLHVILNFASLCALGDLCGYFVLV